MFIIAFIVTLLFGGIVYVKPEKVIEFQQWFYSLINWRMEPISMAKEVRNTRLMGLFLVIFALICCVYYWLQ